VARERKDSDPGASRPFLERPIAIVTLVGGLLGTVTVVLALAGLPSGSSDDGNDGADTPAARIDRCVAHHGLRAARDKDRLAPDRIVFRGCVWPASLGVAEDGFFEITSLSRPGPGRSEAEGLTVADVLTTPCRDIEVRYLFDNMGTFVPEQPVQLTKGEIRRVEGGSIWTPRNETEAAEFTPGRDQFTVLSAGRYRLDSARCFTPGS